MMRIQIYNTCTPVLTAVDKNQRGVSLL